MKHDDASPVVVIAMQALAGAGIPAFAIYEDDQGWHLAGPAVAGDVLAARLRLIADRCEAELVPEGVTIQ